MKSTQKNIKKIKKISVNTFLNVFLSINTFVRSHVSVEQTLSEVGLVAGHALEGPGPDALVLPGVVHQVALGHEADLADVAFERLLTVVFDSDVFVNTEKFNETTSTLRFTKLYFSYKTFALSLNSNTVSEVSNLCQYILRLLHYIVRHLH